MVEMIIDKEKNFNTQDPPPPHNWTQFFFFFYDLLPLPPNSELFSDPPPL